MRRPWEAEALKAGSVEVMWPDFHCERSPGGWSQDRPWDQAEHRMQVSQSGERFRGLRGW